MKKPHDKTGSAGNRDLPLGEPSFIEAKQNLVETEKAVGFGFWRFDIRAESVWASDGLYALYGLDPASFTPTVTNIVETVHPDDRALWNKAMADALKGKGPASLDFRILLPDGNFRYARIFRTVTDTDDCGRPVKLFGVVQDITDQMKAEKARLRSEELLSKAFQASPASIIISRTSDGRFIEANIAFEHLFGHDRQAILGRTSRELGFWQDHNDRERLVRTLVAGRPVRNWECLLRKKGSVPIIGLVSAELIELGGDPCILWVIVDITEHKKARKALEESEERFRNVFEQGPFGMAITGEDQTTLRANAAFCEMLGYTEEELRRLTPRHIVHPDDFNEDARRFQDLIKGAIPFIRKEKRYIRKDGSIVWGSSTMTAIRGTDGHILYLLSMVEDISQQKLAEGELRLKSLSLEEANIALRVLLKQREEDKEILETIIQENISKLVFPHIERMRESRLTESQTVFLDMIAANLQSVISPFLRKASFLNAHLTPSEIQVANLIKNGKTSKEIAALLGLSKRTIDSHRENIRTKLGLAKGKINLTSYLHNLD